jgi:hypothetical protein
MNARNYKQEYQRAKTVRTQESPPRMIVHIERDYYAPGSDAPLHRAGKTVEMPEAAALILIDLKFAKPASQHWERR